MSNRSHTDAGSRMEPDTKDLQPELTDEQWSLIVDLLSHRLPGSQGGRPKANARVCFEGILWVLRSGAHSKDLPFRFPSYVTC